MVASSPLNTRPRWQWEADSTSSPWPDPGNAPWNCGPTSIAKIAEFYKDRQYHVNGVRRLARVADLRPTNVSDQKSMLDQLGVPCDIKALTLSQLRSILSSGRRPVLIGLDMSRVPLAMAGHPFRGAHAVVALALTIRNGVAGILIMDPNFSPRTGRTDPTGGKRFYPNSVIDYAMASAATQRWCVVPRAAKVVPVTSPAPTETTYTVEGLPVSFRANRTGMKASIKAGKPRRAAARISATNYGTTTKVEAMTIWGEVDGEDLTKYGLAGGDRWFFGPQYIGQDRVVFVPYADLTDRVNI